MSAPIETLLPPNSREAERSILGSILRDQLIIDEVMAELKEDDFYNHGHQIVYRAFCELAVATKNIDIVTVAEVLAKAKKMDDIGGAGYLAELWDAAPSSGHWRHYAEIVRDRAMRRGVIRAGAELSGRPYDLTEESAVILADVERTVGELAGRAVKGDSVTIQQALSETYDRLDARRDRGGDVTGVPTGFVDLDNILCGFQDSELIVIGARPSVGKTAFGINLVRHASLDCGIPTLFVSLEQARTELAERLLCIEGRIDSHKLRRGHLAASEESDLMDGGARLSQAPLHFDDASVQDMTRIGANARRLKRKKDIRFLVIDYLQLIDADRRMGSNRQEQVAAISRRLKAIARDLKIPVVALCQVNRGPEDRQSKEPRLSDLRESGAIEADADTVLLLHRVEEDSGPTTSRIDVIVAKQRNGPTGRASLVFEKKYMRFFDGVMH